MSASGHDPDRPWGHWWRLESRTSQLPHFLDEDGRGWRTIREAFWVGRLGMPLVRGEVPDEQIELVHAILSTKLAPGRKRVFPDVLADLVTVHFIHSWLAGAGLLGDDDDPLDRGLSEEGLSVVRMLDVTRPQPVGRQRPCRATIDELMAELRGESDGEHRRARVEGMARGWGGRLPPPRRRRPSRGHARPARRRPDPGDADRLDAALPRRAPARRLLR